MPHSWKAMPVSLQGISKTLGAYHVSWLLSLDDPADAIKSRLAEYKRLSLSYEKQEKAYRLLLVWIRTMREGRGLK